jgi:Protein of unknown function (DUF2865)
MRRLFDTCWSRPLLALCCFAMSFASFGTAARAEGFFERLFGVFSAPQPRRTLPPPQSRVAPQPLFAPYSSTSLPHSPSVEEAETLPRRSAGQYRTVCVRLCDGYFFPISSGVSSYAFRRDANICRSRCGAETRLFSMPASAPRIEDALDQNGVSYAKLRTAFLYRKKFVSGCSCRPDPWSRSERARHASYAEEQQRQIEERAQQAAEQRAVANGVVADAARELFGQHLAEVLPPAPDKDWRQTEPTPVRVAMTPPVIDPVGQFPGPTWSVSTQPVRQVLEIQKPVQVAPVAYPVHPTAANNAWLSRFRGTDPRASPTSDGP